MVSEHGQTLLVPSSGQEADTDTQELPPEHEEGFLSFVGDQALNRQPREGVESPSPEIFQNRLDTPVPCALG